VPRLRIKFRALAGHHLVSAPMPTEAPPLALIVPRALRFRQIETSTPIPVWAGFAPVRTPRLTRLPSQSLSGLLDWVASPRPSDRRRPSKALEPCQSCSNGPLCASGKRQKGMFVRTAGVDLNEASIVSGRGNMTILFCRANRGPDLIGRLRYCVITQQEYHKGTAQSGAAAAFVIACIRHAAQDANTSCNSSRQEDGANPRMRQS